MSRRSIEFFVPGEPHPKVTVRSGPRRQSKADGGGWKHDEDGKPIVGTFGSTPNDNAKAHIQSQFHATLGFNFEPLDGPLEMRMVIVWPLFKSLTKKRLREIESYWTMVMPEGAFLWQSAWAMARKYPQVYRAKRPDLSNILKQAEDSLNKVAFMDDGQIVVSHNLFVLGPEPGLHIWLRELT